MRSCILFCSLLVSVLSQDTKARESRLVHIDSGLVRGYKDTHDDVFVFYGIPYATAPTGSERFQAPLPPPVWMNTLEAVNNSIICPQRRNKNLIPESKIMQEDCLIANIYVPVTNDTDLSVVVYIHGGGFSLGYGNLMTPKKLVASQKIIAVTFNYRLGAHGFLCLGTKGIPGNAGMKDQVALLRWVKRNIGNFGGNANDITLAGYSAGASFAGIMMISKVADGLFNKVILESSSILSPHSFQLDPIQNAKEYAKMINIDHVDDMSKLENEFKNAPYNILQSGNVFDKKDFTFTFAPCIERDNGQETLLKDNPANLLREGNYTKLPLLFGCASMEGLLFMDKFDVWQKEINENFAYFLPADLNIKSNEDKALLANKVKSFYFGDNPIDNNSVLQYIYFMSDVFLTCPLIRTINNLVKAGHNNVFMFKYSYTDENTPFVPHTHVRGADHCTLTYAILDGFGPYLIQKDSSTSDFIKMRITLRKLWGSFIKNGSPTASEIPAWTPVNQNSSSHMIFKKDSEPSESLFEERCLFWDEIYSLNYKFPIAP